MTPLKLAIKTAGGVTKLSKLLNLSRAAIYLWKNIPAERVIAVERATGIPRQKLRPDLYETKS